MLTLAAISGATYYTSLASYYVGAGPCLGRAHLALGVSQVGPRELSHLLSGRSPDGARALVQPPRQGVRRRAAWDATFSAPKSVSVAFALARGEEREALLAAHERSVAAAVTYLEERALVVTRRGHGGHTHVPAMVLGAPFTHTTSRALEPSLHTHVVLPNVGFAPGDGRFGALWVRDLFAAKRVVGGVYRASLAAELRALGYRLRLGRHSFELDDVSDTTIDAVSSRRAAILAELARRGAHGGRAAAVAALATRTQKQHVETAVLDEHWAALLAGVHVQREHTTQPPRPRTHCTRAVVAAANALAASQASFSRTELDGAVLRALEHQGVPLGDVIAAVDGVLAQGDQVLGLGHDRFTTRPHAELERRLLGLAEAARRPSDGGRVQHDTSPENATSRTLHPEQHKAFRHLIDPTGSIAVLEGLAGSGKSTLLRAVAEHFARESVPVQGCAVARSAAQNLARASGIPSTSVAALCRALRRGSAPGGSSALPADGVLVIDEASMLGTDDLVSLLEGARAARARTILVGDRHQLPALVAGGGFAALADLLGAAELRTVRRQRAPWMRAAALDLADGNVDGALMAYAEHGHVRVHASDADALHATAAAAAAHVAQGGTWSETLILASTRADVHALNRAVQATRAARGELGGAAVAFGAAHLCRGDRVVLRRNEPGLGLVNGARGVVTSITPTLGRGGAARARVRLDGDVARDVTLSSKLYSEIELGYASTIHRAQGLTVSASFVLARGLVDRELTYVALSRHRERAEIHLVGDDLPDDVAVLALGKRAARSRARMTALPLAHLEPGEFLACP